MRIPGTLPANSRTSASVPTLTMMPWRLAIACDTESLLSAVRMWPWSKTRSALGLCASRTGVSKAASKAHAELSLQCIDIVKFSQGGSLKPLTYQGSEEDAAQRGAATAIRTIVRVARFIDFPPLL